jgi:hypothetical protein
VSQTHGSFLELMEQRVLPHRDAHPDRLDAAHAWDLARGTRAR